MTDKKANQKEPAYEDVIKQLKEEFAKLTVKDFLSQTLLTLSTLAYQKMGVPSGNEPYKDLNQAKLAIDAYSSLLKTLEPHLEQENIDTCKNVLSKMQLDFVAQQG